MNRLFFVSTTLAVLCLAHSARAQFSASFYDLSANPPATIDAAEAGFTAADLITTVAPSTINYAVGASPLFSGAQAFPVGTQTSDYGLDAIGIVSGLSAPVTLSLGVYSDDGFRLRLNGVVVAEFAGVRTVETTTTAPLALHNGDSLELTYFQSTGSSEVEFFTVDANGQPIALVGDPLSGINIVPEPSTWAMLGLGAVGASVVALRRRWVVA